jgi:hypothetical protein
MSRLFIDIHLRQWPEGKNVILSDLDGNIVTLDGLIHDRPHQFILVELPIDSGVIHIPGHFTDYHPHNGRDLGADAPHVNHLGERLSDAVVKVERIPHPKPKVKIHPEKGLVWAHNGEPVNAQTSASADKPLGVHKDVTP